MISLTQRNYQNHFFLILHCCHCFSLLHSTLVFCQTAATVYERDQTWPKFVLKNWTQVTFRSSSRPTSVGFHKCVSVCAQFKSCTYTQREKKAKTTTTYRKRKEKALDNTIDFPTMVSESGKLENTMMHGAHKGPTNCSFVFENTPRFERLCHQSIREPNCDRFCLAVICRASKSSNLTFFFLVFLSAASAGISRVVVSHMLHSEGIKKE